MNYKDIANKFNINIKNEQLFIDAFTHSSFSNEKRNSCADYERIEFVGVGVLDFIIADFVFQQYPNLKQGEMTKLRANLVCSSSLAKYAKEFGGAMLLGVNGVVVKGHGNSDAYSFERALDLALRMAKTSIVSKIKEGFAEIEEKE